MTVTAQERGKTSAPEALENNATAVCVKGYRATVEADYRVAHSPLC